MEINTRKKPKCVESDCLWKVGFHGGDDMAGDLSSP